MKLMLKHLSSCYKVKQILEEDIWDVYILCKGNPTYYIYMKSEPTIENVKEDLTAFPPGKAMDDKHFVGFYKENQLIAIMDLIIEYPNNNTIFIGLFMLNKEYQGIGIGTKIINDALNFLKKEGYGCARLGFVKGNLQSEKFWTKNKFIPTGIEVEKENYTVVVMQRDL
ncbi:GNAT family N-acetyltransferase [[Clostridium] fimetarium]|uniref:Ribosomal protein S18 acetylase RimI n=1 Tax=[Clostridium] fimetarium TaxID=99656 RepID=A0A1I0P772_9FIRM|nr:GNAT family N-acetyltransferase [[Clostridium] fimetarium]SEW10204.1 Ribosomal protein S18 acetylase RimI [[Clostridium] fimetarium]